MNTNNYCCRAVFKLQDRAFARICIGFCILAVLAIAACDGHEGGSAEAASGAKLILIIGDGMDDQQITIARNYLVGGAGRLALDDMPHRGAAQAQGVAEDNPEIPVYVTSSANTATAMASGTLTSRMRIGTAAKTDSDLVSIMELASDAGIATGIVTTASITDATPASFVAHISHRLCQGPESMQRTNDRFPQFSYDCHADRRSSGGPGSIAEQIAGSKLDIILGGGRRYFDQFVEGSANTTVLSVARSNGFTTIANLSEMPTVEESSRILGLFSEETMPVRLAGEDGAVAERIPQTDGQLRMPDSFTCVPNPEFEGVPTLVDMMRAAIDSLDQHRQFMLMVESASIDKQSHARKPCGHIGELGQLDDAVRIALSYAAKNPETLVLVTADHGHAAHIIAETSDFLRQNFATPGRFARIRTPEGGIMGINYASTDFPGWEQHSGVQIPLFASGPGADELPAFVRQAEIFHIAAKHLALQRESSTQ
jgi:alkaline phosphatase